MSFWNNLLQQPQQGQDQHPILHALFGMGNQQVGSNLHGETTLPQLNPTVTTRPQSIDASKITPEQLNTWTAPTRSAPIQGPGFLSGLLMNTLAGGIGGDRTFLQSLGRGVVGGIGNVSSNNMLRQQQDAAYNALYDASKENFMNKVSQYNYDLANDPQLAKGGYKLFNDVKTLRESQANTGNRRSLQNLYNISKGKEPDFTGLNSPTVMGDYLTKAAQSTIPAATGGEEQQKLQQAALQKHIIDHPEDKEALALYNSLYRPADANKPVILSQGQSVYNPNAKPLASIQTYIDRGLISPDQANDFLKMDAPNQMKALSLLKERFGEAPATSTKQEANPYWSWDPRHADWEKQHPSAATTKSTSNTTSSTSAADSGRWKPVK